jgi:hypothetical protein
MCLGTLLIGPGPTLNRAAAVSFGGYRSSPAALTFKNELNKRQNEYMRIV